MKKTKNKEKRNQRKISTGKQLVNSSYKMHPAGTLIYVQFKIQHTPKNKLILTKEKCNFFTKLF